MNKRSLTQLMILITLIIWIGWDLWVYNVSGNPSTISAIIWTWCWHIPGIPFAIGVLIGHVVFQLHEPTIWPLDDQGKEIKN